VVFPDSESEIPRKIQIEKREVLGLRCARQPFITTMAGNETFPANVVLV
jgi:hypothetical protein